LLGLDQDAFAERVGVSINTVRLMEGRGADSVGGYASTRERVCESLMREGVEFLNDGEPGCGCVRAGRSQRGGGD